MPTPIGGPTIVPMHPSRSRAASVEARRRLLVRASPPELDVYDLLMGLTLATAGRAVAGWRVGQHALRPVVGFALRPPLLPVRLQPVSWLKERARVGGDYRLRAAPLLQELALAVIDAVLDRIDLTSIVLERVELNRIIDSIDIDRIVARIDLDSVVAQVDIDGIAARLDLDAIIDRMDLAALAREVIDDIDLPQIIQQSTGTMASEAVVGIRIQGIQADDHVSRIVDRLLLRRRARKTQTRALTGAEDETQR